MSTKRVSTNRRMHFIGNNSIFKFLSGSGIIGFMGIIAISGNLSFLNHLTMIPPLCALDDRCLKWLFSENQVRNARIAEKTLKKSKFRRIVHFLLYCLIAKLSYPVAANLLSSRQVMNTSFDPLSYELETNLTSDCG